MCGRRLLVVDDDVVGHLWTTTTAPLQTINSLPVNWSVRHRPRSHSAAAGILSAGVIMILPRLLPCNSLLSLLIPAHDTRVATGFTSPVITNESLSVQAQSHISLSLSLSLLLFLCVCLCVNVMTAFFIGQQQIISPYRSAPFPTVNFQTHF